MNLPRLLVAAALAAAPCAALAQYKISDVKGARLMNATEIRAEIVGFKMAGLTDSGFQFDLKLDAVGWVQGMAHGPRGGSSGVTGRWTFNTENQVCTDLTFTTWRTKAQRCTWYLKAGGEYFSANSKVAGQTSARLASCLTDGGPGCDDEFTLGKRRVNP